jgi:hypothetical protein
LAHAQDLLDLGDGKFAWLKEVEESGSGGISQEAE